MADVFISYKREERARVQRIAQGLQELGLSVWFDASLEGGGSFSAQINREVRAAKCVLVCWTPAAAHSEWVIGEAEIGRTRGVLAPVLLAPTDLPPPFNTLHAFDLMNWIGDHGDAQWRALLDRVGSLVGRTGLRHLALAVQDSQKEAAQSLVAGSGQREAPHLSFQDRAALPQLPQTKSRGSLFESVGACLRFFAKVGLVFAFGPIALWRMRRWVLLSVWFGFFALGCWLYYWSSSSYPTEPAPDLTTIIVVALMMGWGSAAFYTPVVFTVLACIPRAAREGFVRGLGFSRKA